MKKTNLTSSENEIKPIGLRNNVLTQELDKELLLYDLARDKVFCLNETSMIIWNLCDGENTVEDLRWKVSSQLKTNINEELIWLTLDMLKSEQLLSNHLEVTINFNGLSRREVIKKSDYLRWSLYLLFQRSLHLMLPPPNLNPVPTPFVFVLM